MHHLLTLLLAAAVLLSPAASTDEAIATVVADQASAADGIDTANAHLAVERGSAFETPIPAESVLVESVAPDDPADPNEAAFDDSPNETSDEASDEASRPAPDTDASASEPVSPSEPEAVTSTSGGWNIERRITFYGPGGHYGKRTACGQVLTTQLVGVATYLYPCGTRIQFKYRGRTIIAPVVDRGPASWTGFRFDLTGRACVNLVGSKGACWTIYNVAWRVVR